MNPDPTICPLCGQVNHCGMASPESINQTCWCMDKEFTFPDSLLNQIPDAVKNKACICRECTLKNLNNQRGEDD